MSDQQQGPGWWLASDGKWYPPQGAVQQPIYVQPAKKGSGCVTVLAVIGGFVILLTVIGLIASAGGSGDDVSPSSDSGESDEVDDVEITDCGSNEYGSMEAQLEVVNNSEDPSTYFIDVSFETEDRSRQFDTGTAVVNNLASGQTTRTDAIAGALDSAPNRFSCRITNVERLAAP